MYKYFVILFVVLAGFSELWSFGESDTLAAHHDNLVKVYIDCGYCDMDFIQTEIQFVNYVIDRNNADVHVLRSRERTASNGRKHTLTFLGKNNFAGRNDTLKYITINDETEDEQRRKLVHYLELGLIPYAAQSDIAEHLSVKYDFKAIRIKPVDNWDHWVFRTSINGNFSGEQSVNSKNLSMNIRADRITEDWKVRIYSGANYNEQKFTLEDENLTSASRGQSGSIQVVKSIADHWSTGISAGVSSSSYANLKLYYNISPAIEYNLFPYSQSTHLELRFLYQFGYNYAQYYEPTIFDKMEEGSLGESMQIVLMVKKPWGTIHTYFTGSHYLRDLSKNRLQVHGELSLSLFDGFSLEFWGGYSRIRDQLSLPKREVTEDEILLRRRQLETQYNYWSSIGISYTFGSIYNNIVNPRFGN
ncbi:MAG: hypothetical protein E4H13_13095 [Calditrichales bacterium]|nr:MAG: hypothetical protein E4H13_13095 [Calditrichales bacterium]